MSTSGFGASFDASSVNHLGEKLTGGAEQQLTEKLTIANRALVVTTRRSLGQFYGASLARRWQVTSSVNTRTLDNLASVQVSTNDKLVRYWEYGTRAHIIRARHAHALRFTAGGKTVFARSVHHPGTPAHNKLAPFRKNFETRVLASWQPAIEEAVKSVFNQG